MLRITKVTDYGFILLVRIASHQQGGTGVCNARDLAALCGVPLPMTSKILKALARGGILASQRGMKGGYALSRPSDAITVGEIIAALEGPVAVTECLGHPPTSCGLEMSCPLQTHWGRINSAIRSALDQITLAEMARPAAGRIQSHEAVTTLDAPVPAIAHA